MSISKIQADRAIRTVPSTVEIPYPANILVSDNSTGVAVNKLICATGLFITRGVRIGDIIYNTQTPLTPTICTVTAIDSETQLSISANNFTASPNSFIVYQSSSNNGVSNPCILYIGTAGNLVVETEGLETVFFSNVPLGFFPVKVRRVLSTGGGGSTTASNIIGLF